MNNSATRDDLRTLINALNAQKSTGPRTTDGKLRSRMNAFKHGLTGNTMILQPHEKAAYDMLTADLLRDHAPANEIERQLVLKIIDTSFRLNRISAIESNILNYNLQMSANPGAPDADLEAIAAQARAWTHDSATFDRLGRYEVRLSKQLIAYQQELERIQLKRIEKVRLEAAAEAEIAALSTPPARKMASFGKPSNLVMRAGASKPANRLPEPSSPRKESPKTTLAA